MAKQNQQHSPGLYYQGFGGIDGEVAGSKHIFLNIGSDGRIKKVLNDMGNDMKMDFHEDKDIPLPQKAEVPFRVDNIDAFVVSHGHFDHMGDVPKLIANGYTGPCYATEPTKDIVKLQLSDGISFDWYRYGKLTRGMSPQQKEKIPRPLMSKKDLDKMMESFNGVKYGTRIGITDGIDAIFYDAGHIIGSAQVLYHFNVNGKMVKVLTAVDLGRSGTDVPLVRFPHTDFPNDIDYMFIESTYGGRLHQSRQQSREELEELTLRAYKDKKRVIEGSFATQRMQQVISDHFWSYKRGNLPADLGISYDCKSARAIFGIMKRHVDLCDEQARIDFENPRENPSKFPNLSYATTKAQSERLDVQEPPYIIISASGMYSMGRIVGHTINHIEKDDAILVITGYQAERTVGKMIEDGREDIKIEGKIYHRKAEVVRLRGYSAHADGNECVDHVVNNVKPRKGVFIVHGEKEQQEWTQKELRAKLPPNVSVDIVRKGQTYNLKPYNG